MKGLPAPLAESEESTLLEIGFGSRGALDHQDLKRLLQRELIGWNGRRWPLTSRGHSHYDTLIADTADGAQAAARGLRQRAGQALECPASPHP